MPYDQPSVRKLRPEVRFKLTIFSIT